MSRSTKLAIIKDRPRNYKKSSRYWRTIRRCQKQAVKAKKEIPNPKSIINDYDYSDYKINYEFESGFYKIFSKHNKRLQNSMIKAKRK